LHRRYDELEHMMYIVAEESANAPMAAVRKRIERRAAVRCASLNS
jgi:hypothetical protein